ncbi:alpha/beta fold hydrolase [Amycolatopsis magusensis]|uniref:alpha/beta fold hydrolase n=1 Tax=Amycolatopsis magusensis TaxID=882444 RepID=UPI003C2DFEAA
MSRTLQVPGATLHYDVRGSGPTLLCIPGGPADAGSFTTFAPELAADHTVITYDPRGLSRSAIDVAPGEDLVGQHADDAHRLLAEVSAEPGFVFASSGGSMTAMELLRRHPGQVRAAILHEPPATSLLPDQEDEARRTAAIDEAYRTGGPFAAIAVFLGSTGLGDGDGHGDGAEPTPEMREQMAAMRPNLDFFFAHLMHAVGDYRPDYPALRALGNRITVAIGEDSRGQLACEAAVALAGELGLEPALFPGDHGGFSEHPAASADLTRKIFS